MKGFVAAETALHEEAAQSCGLDDFGEDDYLEGLRVLLTAFDAEAPLSPAGIAAMRGMLVEALIGRLLSQRGFREAPESADAPVEAPLVIVGLPRTGSTALQHLLAQDPALQGLELWHRSVERSMEARARRDPAQFYDLHFRDFSADPLAAIARIYEHFDVSLGEEARKGMLAFRQAHPPGEHGAHAYTLEEYGLDADEIRERFADYIAIYGVEPEARTD